MNRIHHCHRLRRTAAVLGAFAASTLALVTGATAAFASPDPPPHRSVGPVPLQTAPGWNKHAPVHAHTAVTGGMPGWHIVVITLIVVAVAIIYGALSVSLDR